MPAAAALPFDDMLRVAVPWIEAAVLAMGRPLGVAIVLPVFTRAQLGPFVANAFALALGLLVIPPIAREIGQAPPAALPLALLGFKEVLLGLLIGFLAGLPIWSVEFAGELLDTQRSATQDRQAEAGTSDENSTTSTFLSTTIVALFVMLGGLGLLARTIYASYAIWPALSPLPLPTRGWASFVLGALDGLTRTGLGLAAPVVLGMLLCESCVILLMRSVPRLNVYDLAPTLRNLMFALMMLAYGGFLVAYLRGDLGTLGHLLGQLRTLLR